MKVLLHRLSLSLLGLALFACSRVEQPRTGIYRAVLELQGAELPLQLQIGTNSGQIQLWLVNGDRKQAATQVVVQQGRLMARLPNEGGMLNAEIRRRGLEGSLTLGASARNVSLPLHATQNEIWRFYEKSLSDNADVSGDWQLTCEDSQMSSRLSLQQSHDQVSGEVQWANARIPVDGQVQGDDLQLGGLGAERALLFRARIDEQGNLQGELLDSAGQKLGCAAMRATEAAAAEL